MSAEKEIANFWYNKQGYFTINNIKTTSNKDAGILALKLNKGLNEVLHIGISCSITNNVAEAGNIEKSLRSVIHAKFDDLDVISAISHHIEQFSIQKHKIRKELILGSMPKSRKPDIIKEFNKNGIKVVEFENIVYEMLEQLDTRYYKNDVIRTLQLVKYLFLNHPDKLAKLVINDNLTSMSRKEFLSNILENEYVIKEFRKTNADRLGEILKSSKIKPDELAGILEKEVLNNKTKRTFLDSLIQNKNIRKIINETIASGDKRAKKADVSLDRFF